MTLSQIETNLKKVINHFDAATFIYDFLLAYNTPKSVIQRFKKGTLNLSKNADEFASPARRLRSRSESSWLSKRIDTLPRPSGRNLETREALLKESSAHST